MVLENKQELLARSFEIAAAIAYFEDAIQESDETISECSPNLQAELEEQKRHFAVALEAMERLARVEAERDALLEYANAQMECETCKHDVFCPLANPMQENCAFVRVKAKVPL